jgi:Protein of unknown function (DUF3108)
VLARRFWVLRGFQCGFVLPLCCFIFFTASTADAGDPAEQEFSLEAPKGMFFVGEDLLYEVSYSIFSLGTVRLKVLDSYTKDSTTIYKAKSFIDSYNVPFVNLHYIFYSEIDSGMFSRFFSAYDTKDSTSESYVNYTFDYSRGNVLVEKGVKPSHLAESRQVDTISTKYQDGLSLFYYARANVHSQKEVNVPSFVDEKKVSTYINFLNKTTSMEIDAVKYPIRTIEFKGRADFVGIFGLTGGFRGWFSDDSAAVPIVARMNVILGSIKLELIKWNRPGWIPPKAKEE